MPRANIYEGPRSCYARREGVYVAGRGVDVRTAEGILYLMLRDLRRGWTYDHSCRRIPMTMHLFVRRAKYLVPLARKHRGPAEAARVKRLVDEVLSGRRKPRPVLVVGRVVVARARAARVWR